MQSLKIDVVAHVPNCKAAMPLLDLSQSEGINMAIQQLSTKEINEVSGGCLLFKAFVIGSIIKAICDHHKTPPTPTPG